MNEKTIGWALRMSVTLGVAGTCAACGAYTVGATSGATFQQSAALPDPLSSALMASAARDLPCEGSDLDVTRLDHEREYAVTGCGRRVLYRALTPSLKSARLELVSRFPSPPAGRDALSPVPSPAAAVRPPHA